MPSIVALIPARFGSKRVPGKNTRPLAGKPLIAYTIDAAVESGVFADICVVTDDDDIALTAAAHSGHVRVMRRSAATATDDAPDIMWVREFFEHNRGGDAFAILRPTSPFRTAETMKRAWAQFQIQQPCDSLRAIERVTQHPGKMWMVQRNTALLPLLPYWTRTGSERTDSPWHSAPTQTLPAVYVQNASLEIAWTRVVSSTDTISGHHIMPFVTEGLEGFDINTEADWKEAERLMAHQPMEYLG